MKKHGHNLFVRKAQGKKQTIVDEINNQYGKLTVVEFDSIKNHIAYWKCRCECGNEIIVAGNHLRSGHTKSADV